MEPAIKTRACEMTLRPETKYARRTRNDCRVRGAIFRLSIRSWQRENRGIFRVFLVAESSPDDDAANDDAAMFAVPYWEAALRYIFSRHSFRKRRWGSTTSDFFVIFSVRFIDEASSVISMRKRDRSRVNYVNQDVNLPATRSLEKSVAKFPFDITPKIIIYSLGSSVFSERRAMSIFCV